MEDDLLYTILSNSDVLLYLRIAVIITAGLWAFMAGGFIIDCMSFSSRRTWNHGWGKTLCDDIFTAAGWGVLWPLLFTLILLYTVQIFFSNHESRVSR